MEIEGMQHHHARMPGCLRRASQSPVVETGETNMSETTQFAKIWRPLVGLGYVRVDSKIQSAEDRIPNLLQGANLVRV